MTRTSPRQTPTRTALDTAFAAFAARYPRWAESLFDRHLLARVAEGADALAALTPRALADAWTRQFGYRDEGARERDVARLAPVAADFLGLLWAELGCDAPRRGSPPGERTFAGGAA